jgi:toxin ParE1/3/4
MTIRWTPTGSDDLEAIYDYIARDSPERAHATMQRIVSEIETLKRHPLTGRKGLVSGTRELVVAPYIVVYHVTEETAEIVHIIHSARQWPAFI